MNQKETKQALNGNEAITKAFALGHVMAFLTSRFYQLRLKDAAAFYSYSEPFATPDVVSFMLSHVEPCDLLAYLVTHGWTSLDFVLECDTVADIRGPIATMLQKTIRQRLGVSASEEEVWDMFGKVLAGTA